MDDLQPSDPKKIGGWTLQGRLGKGGMGVVYMASKSGKTVALKVINAAGLTNPKVRKRFIQEVHSLSLLRNPFVAPLIDYDVSAKNPWYAVEYISDMSLSDVLKSAGSFTGKNWWNLAQNLLMALVAIHKSEVIHRDLKPQNIMISKDIPKLIDFGLAKPISEGIDGSGNTAHNQVLGTPYFMSPEQSVSTKDVDEKTDIWAIGVTLIEAAGHNAWDATDSHEIMQLIREGKTPNMSKLDPSQKALVSVMLYQDPEERWSAIKILKNLETFYNHKNTPAAVEIEVKSKSIAIPNRITVEADKVHLPEEKKKSPIIGNPKKGEEENIQEKTKFADRWPQKAFPLASPKERIFASFLDMAIFIFGLTIIWPIWFWRLRNTGLTPGRKIIGLVIIDSKTRIPVPLKRVYVRGIVFTYSTYGILGQFDIEKYGWLLFIPIALALPLFLEKRQTAWDFAFKTTVGRYEKIK